MLRTSSSSAGQDSRGTLTRGAAPALVTLGYVVVTLPLLWRGGPTEERALLSIGHAVAAVCLWWAARRPVSAGAFADWLPLLLVPLLYAELPYLMGAAPVYHDAVVQRWEATLFGGQPARTLAGGLRYRWLSELLHLGYLSYYPVIYLPPLLLYLTGRREAFARAVLASMLVYSVCFLTFAVFPVQGPRYLWGTPASVPEGPIRSLARLILERGSSRGTAFPSSHAAIAAAQAIVTLPYARRLGIGVAIASLTLMIGAVYGGFHYAVDIIAGAAIGLVIGTAVLPWRR
jgi:membrane-associated phospholipid phosphatase